MKEACQCGTPKLSEGHTIKTAIARYTGQKGVHAQMPVHKGTFASPGNNHGQMAPYYACQQQLLKSHLILEVHPVSPPETKKLCVEFSPCHIDNIKKFQKLVDTITGELEEKGQEMRSNIVFFVSLHFLKPQH